MFKQLFLLASLLVFTMAQLSRNYPKQEIADKELLAAGLTKENLDMFNKFFRQLDYDLAIAKVDEFRTLKKNLQSAVIEKVQPVFRKMFETISDEQRVIYDNYLSKYMPHL